MALATKGKSKLKMVALMPPKQDNITWYSPEHQNNKPNDVIITGMLRRFMNQKAAAEVVVYQFYEDGNLVQEIKRP